METYKTVQGDMWDLISYKVYGNEKFVDVLIAENPQYRKVLVFSAGVEIICPDVDTDNESGGLPPWKAAVE